MMRSGSTATGIQLAERLVRLIGGLQAGAIPAAIGRPLAKAAAKAEHRLARRAALAELRWL